MPEPGPPGVGEQVVPGRAPPAARAAPGCVAQLGLPRLDQRVEMPADRRRRQLQLGRDRRRGARPLLHQQPGDGRAGATLGLTRLGTAAGTDVGARAPAYGGRVHDGSRAAAFHNTSVAYIRVIGKVGPPERGGRVSGLTVGPGRYPADMSRVGLGTPPPAAPAAQVGVPEAGPATIRDPARIPRRLGLTGALMMGIGALGAGALPVPNPLFGLRVISLPARNATAAIAITYAGMGMLVLAWLWIGQMLRARGAVAPAPDRTQLARTGLLWALPLALAPPMFSKDVYSYLAQSAITARGLDPYSLGPAAALGVDDPLTRTIPTIWRDTPAPYGPLFLMLGRGITALTGSDVIQGVYAHRVLALCGVALIIWALPRLARRCDLDAGLVLWLGAVNPLVLFHLVSGIHNEGLMIGLMLAGVELVLRALDRGSGFLRDPRFVLGVVVVSLGAAVKLPALLALGFVGMAAARLRGGRVRDVAVVAAVSGAIAAAVFVVLGVGTGLGFGWTRTLGTANVIRSWMSLATDLGQLSGSGRDPRRPRRPHRHGAHDHPRARRAPRRAAVPAAAAARAARPARPGDRAGRRPGGGRAARTGGAPLVPAVGGDPAGRDARHAAAPARRPGGVGPARGHAAPDGFRLRVPVVPAAAGDPRRDPHPGGRAAGRAAGAACVRVARSRDRPGRRRARDPRRAPLVVPPAPAPTGEPAPLHPRDVAAPPSPTGPGHRWTH